MTLSEKVKKQEAIINDLFSSLVEVPKSIETHASFFRHKIKQLFLIEMEFYGIQTPLEANLIFDRSDDTGKRKCKSQGKAQHGSYPHR